MASLPCFIYPVLKPESAFAKVFSKQYLFWTAQLLSSAEKENFANEKVSDHSLLLMKPYLPSVALMSIHTGVDIFRLLHFERIADFMEYHETALRIPCLTLERPVKSQHFSDQR